MKGWEGVSFEAARAVLAFLAVAISASSCAIFSSSYMVAGRAISTAVKSVAFGPAFVMVESRGLKGEIVLGLAGLLGFLRKGALASEDVEVVIIGGGGVDNLFWIYRW